jgi:hypothetical protein
MQVSSRVQGSRSLGAALGVVSVLALALLATLAPAAMAAPATASYVVVLKDEVAHPAYLAHRHERNRDAEITHVYGVAIKGYSANLTAGQRKAIEKDPNVKYVESDGVIRPKGQAVGNQLKRVYANLSKLRIDENDVPADRVNADIAILDTGVYQHPDLNIVHRVICVEGGGECVPGLPDDDRSGHGTHVAGDAAAIDNGIGMVGTAPGARIWSVKVVNRMGYVGSDIVGTKFSEPADPAVDLQEGNAQMSDAIAGIDYVTAHSSEIEVANMSFACSTEQWGCARTALAEAIATSVNSGVVWVAAAGHNGKEVAAGGKYDLRHYPALLSDVITVSAMADYDGLPGSLSNSNGCPLEKGTQVDDRLMGEGNLSKNTDLWPPGSNFGPEVDIAAPGSCVFSTWSPYPLNNPYDIPPEVEYGFMYGSSVASALVAGAAADLAAEFNPSSRADVEKIRATLLSAGNYNWQDLRTFLPGDPAVSPDGVQEPLLDMHTFGAPAPSAPSVSTAPPEYIGPTSAKLLGWLNPNGQATNFYFQIGLTSNYTVDVPAKPGWEAGSANAPKQVAFDITGLEAGRTYHYRLVASSPGGTTYGDDMVFATLGPPTATTEPAVEITDKRARLTGLVNPNGLSTGYYFQYGKTTDYTYTVPFDAPPGWNIGSGTSNQSVWTDIAALEVNTTYHYRVVATNSAGTTYGADRTFATLPFAPSASTQPPTEVGETSVKLNGLVTPKGPSTTYYFQFGKTTSYGSNYPTPPGPSMGPGPTTPVSYKVTGLEPGVTYHYRLRATNSGGTDYGADKTFTTPTPYTPVVESTPPGEVTQSKITMAAKADVKGLAGTYYFEYGNTELYGSKSAETAVPAGSGFQAVSQKVGGLPSGWTLHYRVVVTNSDRTVVGPDQAVTTGWADEPSTAPGSSKSDWLKDVFCPSAGNCIAVGAYVHSSSGNTVAAAERWDGTSWTPITPPAPAGTYSELQGVACVTVSNCLAVGSALPAANSARPLIMKWNGSAWTEVSAGSQVPTGYQNYLNDISCPAANSCEAVGYSAPASGPSKPLAMHWDGSVWTVRASAVPNQSGGEPAQESSALEAVSCASTTACKAVGRLRSSVSGTIAMRPVLQRLSGSEWLSETPELTSHAHMWLEGVSCPSANVCFAVGSSGESATGEPPSPFVQRWNGTKWSYEWPLTLPENYGPVGLYDISCASVNSCRATGLEGRGVRWTGSEWRLQVPKAPANLDASQPGKLNGVSCPTTTECHAVGSYRDKSPTTVRLTQGWSGNQAMPGTAGDAASLISESGAQLRALVDPAGVETTYFFEWGLTSEYGSKTASFNAGSGGLGPKGGRWVVASATISGLQPGVKYQYRVVATNGINTSYGPNTTFETLNRLNEMPVTEAFGGGTSPISNFVANWAPLQWTGSTRKGKNNSNGYGPVDTAANGAYFLPTVTDTGLGVAAEGTIATGPGVGGRVSLWLDMGSPATAKSGYELSFLETSASVYTVTLKKWVSGVETSLATKTGYASPAGSSLALVDQAGTVAAWGNVGAGFVKIISASDSAFAAGSAGVEVSGSTATRVTKFKLGSLLYKVASADLALKTIPVADAFTREESPLSLSGSWSALAWDAATVKTGKVTSASGWSADSSSIAGAYWQKAQAADTGNGDAVTATVNKAIGGSPNYLALWLNAPNPGSTKNGYQLRVAETSTNTAEVKIIKWVGGAATTLATKTGLTFSGGLAGTQFALVSKVGTVSAYMSPSGGMFSQLLTAADYGFSYGYAGVEGVGTYGAFRDFRVGQLAAF